EVEDALEDDVDFIMALYREDGTPVVTPLEVELANDLDDLIAHLQRLPGDSGAAALVSISGEFFAAVRVRGRHVHVVLSDVYAAENWSLARDIVDFLGVDIPEDDDEDGLVGDLDLFADQGLSEMDLEAICADWDEDSDTLALQIADEIHFGPQARKVADSFS
ncbi:MAG TPA: tRNA adenosine deaminase-associated protein, partial [Propionibacteriaceae bacterium]|nr:tRNA adenosine deaminase-associated protein [Propionibacteriaceae bacterium]